MQAKHTAIPTARLWGARVLRGAEHEPKLTRQRLQHDLGSLADVGAAAAINALFSTLSGVIEALDTLADTIDRHIEPPQ